MKHIFPVLFTLYLLQTANAQDKMGVVTLYKNNREGQRKALVMGNQNYQNQPTLRNTLNDADSMAVALRVLGFTVTLIKDKTLPQTKDALDRFVASLQPGDVAFVYYSGHGIGYQRDNYLMPVEFAIETLDETRNRAISTTELRAAITKRSVRNLFLVVDACRNEMAAKAGNGAYALVPPEDNPPGTLVAFATDYGQTATYKSRNNKNSLYTESLLLYLRQPLEVQEIFRQANNRTYAESKRLGLLTQYPHYIPMIYDDYYFLKRATPTPPPARDLPPFMEMVAIPGGTFEMGSSEGASDEKPVHTVTVSSFWMGKYEVMVSQFAQFIAETNYQTDAEKAGTSSIFNPATGSWKDSTGINWRHDATGTRRPASDYNNPVIHVSHNDAVAFCAWLSKKENRPYRLPTEAEWEYAAGNGRVHTKYSWGNGEPTGKVGNVADETAKKTSPGWTIFNGYTDGYTYTAPVGVFAPNGLGLHDMSGNVWEWCSDWYGSDYYANSNNSPNPTGPSTGSYRVLRGGSWCNDPQFVRVANRNFYSPSNRDNDVGFRVVSQSQ